ncbi:MAG: hypothetical protein K2M87_03985 [Muribaculaceae bacterium]|nr:hypothetical protein [Muribaculaceae bacterium]
MKEKVIFSKYSLIVTILSILIIIGVALYIYRRSEDEAIVWILLGVTVIWGFLTLFYAPTTIELTDNSLQVNRSIRVKEIPLEDIKDVKLSPPTMAEMRLCGSGGFFGYWGWYSENDLGHYFAYYGKASDCFLVTLKNGSKYMLGCNNAPGIVKAIKQKL